MTKKSSKGGNIPTRSGKKPLQATGGAPSAVKTKEKIYLVSKVNEYHGNHGHSDPKKHVGKLNDIHSGLVSSGIKLQELDLTTGAFNTVKKHFKILGISVS